MSNDFGIGLGGEAVAFFDQLFLEGDVVLDNAVVHDDDAAGAITVRMRIFLRGAAMRGPAGMANAIGAVDRLQADDFFEVAQLAFGAADLQSVAVPGNRDAGGVISAIFQPLEPIQNDGHDSLLPHISHNAAHAKLLFRWGNRRILFADVPSTRDLEDNAYRAPFIPPGRNETLR